MPESPTPRAWSLFVPLPTFTVNQTRQMHHHTLGRLVRDYRTATCLLARQARIPHLDRVALEFTPRGPKIRQDCAACAPAAKAFLDGLVDAGVLDDDRPEFVPRVTFLAPLKGEHGLHALLVDLSEFAPDHGTYQAKLGLTPATG